MNTIGPGLCNTIGFIMSSLSYTCNLFKLLVRMHMHEEFMNLQNLL